MTLTWSAQNPIVRAQFIHTTEPIPLMKISGDSRKDWEHVKWQVQDIPLPTATTLSDGTRQATFALTAGLKAGYLNLIDDRSLAVSSDFLNLDP